MSPPLKNYLDALRKEKKARKRFTCVVTAMSFLVSGSVFWQLRSVGIAMINSGGDNIDEAVPAGEVSYTENAACWEASLPLLTDSASENLALIAESQIGYSEKYTVYDGSEECSRYTRYGDWYGSPASDWNTLFTYFCLNYAGVTSEQLPYGSGCWAWSLTLEKENLIIPANKGSPGRGDILILDTDSDGKADRSCIVCKVTDDTGTTTIFTIEGDVGGKVGRTSYSPDDESIVGIVSLDDIVPNPPYDTSERTDAIPMSFTAESDSGVIVNASADIGVFPADTMMLVTDIPHNEAIRAAAENLGAKEDELDAVAVDISFITPDGTELEPYCGRAVDVSITLPEKLKLPEGTYSLLHVTDSGDVNAVEDADVTGFGAEFTAEQFSMYVMTSTGYIDKDDSNLINGSTEPNSSDARYIVDLGDKFILRTKVVFWDASQGYQYGDFSSIISQANISTAVVEEDGVQYLICEREYTALNTGTTQITVVTDSEGTQEHFYIKVRPAIYVKTEVGEIKKDYVHAYLEDVYYGNPNYNYINEVTLNGDGTVTSTHMHVQNMNYDMAKYLLYAGESVTLVSYIPISVAPDENGKYYSYTGAATTLTETSEDLGNGIRKVTAIVTADSIGDRTVSIANEPFYIYARSATDERLINHSDIEIAEGGQYVAEKIVDYPDGSSVRTITRYKAYVSGVNESVIYDAENHILQTYTTPDYWFDPAFKPGDSQYEYTSAYRKDASGTHESEKKFRRDLAHHVTFDVSLKLIPDTEEVITTSGGVSTSVISDISGRDEVNIPSVFFEMNNQSLIDAFNKCPNHGGLDFTIQANLNEVVNSIVVPVNASKTLQNGTLNDSKFEFELSDIEMYAMKVGDRYEGKKIVDITDIFSNISADDEVIAYRLMEFPSCAFANGFDFTSFGKAHSAYNNEWAFGQYIDRMNSGSFDTTDIAPEEFYNTLFECVNADNYILPDSSGFNIESGFYLFVKRSHVAFARNDAAGNVQFPDQIFIQPGVYHYYISEKAVPGDANYTYDNSLKKVTITVTSDSTGKLSSTVTYDGSASPPTFTNTQMHYMLPETGGSGCFLYFIFGTSTIMAAIILLIIRRRREEV